MLLSAPLLGKITALFHWHTFEVRRERAPGAPLQYPLCHWQGKGTLHCCLTVLIFPLPHSPLYMVAQCNIIDVWVVFVPVYLCIYLPIYMFHVPLYLRCA